MNPKFSYRAEGVTLSYLRTFPGCPRAIPSGQRCQKPTGLKSGLVDAPVQVPQAVGFVSRTSGQAAPTHCVLPEAVPWGKGGAGLLLGQLHAGNLRPSTMASTFCSLWKPA